MCNVLCDRIRCLLANQNRKWWFIKYSWAYQFNQLHSNIFIRNSQSVYWKYWKLISSINRWLFNIFSDLFAGGYKNMYTLRRHYMISKRTFWPLKLDFPIHNNPANYISMQPATTTKTLIWKTKYFSHSARQLEWNCRKDSIEYILSIIILCCIPFDRNKYSKFNYNSNFQIDTVIWMKIVCTWVYYFVVHNLTVSHKTTWRKPLIGIACWFSFFFVSSH